jgi:hypothetical protein
MFRVYYTDVNGIVGYDTFDSDKMTDALKYMETLRKEGHYFVVMASENPHLVGKAGVAGVVNGTLPNGEKYEYTKRDALSQRTKLSPVSTDNLIVNLDDPH